MTALFLRPGVTTRLELGFAVGGLTPAPETHRPANPRWAVLAGTATSKDLRGHRSQTVNLLRRVGATGWGVERWTHIPKAREFFMTDWLSMPTAAIVA